MLRTTHEQRRQILQTPRNELRQSQIKKINLLLDQILPHNRFYAARLASVKTPIESFDQFESLPFTFKEDLVSDVRGHEFAANLTFPVEQYVRYHRTSGTKGKPLVVLDTAADWNWWIEGWQYALDAAEVTADDRVVMAFSFGPFIGFWSAFDAVLARGAMVVPAGSMSTEARLDLIRSSRATSVFCTPSYALHMAEFASEAKLDLREWEVRRVIVAGEPGGSTPAIQRKIEQLWNARLVDHAGASEVGPWGFADYQGRGLIVNEYEFVAEFLSIGTGEPAKEGELAELVITTLGRVGSPVVRYRTGDMVRPYWNHDRGTTFAFLEGGILGRVDDMMIIRGVNVFPSSIEHIIRSFPEVIEYRMTATKTGAMDELRVEIEDRLGQPQRVEREFELRLGLRVPVTSVPLGSLPRFEGKGRRFLDHR